MNFLFDDASPSASPPDTEAVRLGAQRIRQLKDLLQSYLFPLFNTNGSFKANVFTGSILQAGSVGSTQLTDQGVLKEKMSNAAFGDGLAKATNAAQVTVNVDNSTIGFDSSTPKKIRVLTIPTKNAPVVGSASNLLVQSASVSTLTVAADEVVLKDASNNPFLATAVNVTVNIALGVALNGLETGATETASTWYYVWLISDGTNVRAVLEDGSSALNGGGAGVAPAGPDLSNAAFTGYTYKALVSVVRNDATNNFVTFYQQGRQLWVNDTVVFTARAAAVAGTFESYSTPGTIDASNLNLKLLVPPNALRMRGTMGSINSTNLSMEIAADASGLAATTETAPSSNNQLNSFNSSVPYEIPLKTAQTFFWRADSTGPRARVTLSGYTI